MLDRNEGPHLAFTPCPFESGAKSPRSFLKQISQQIMCRNNARSPGSKSFCLLGSSHRVMHIEHMSEIAGACYAVWQAEGGQSDINPRGGDRLYAHSPLGFFFFSSHSE